MVTYYCLQLLPIYRSLSVERLMCAPGIEPRLQDCESGVLTTTLDQSSHCLPAGYSAIWSGRHFTSKERTVLLLHQNVTQWSMTTSLLCYCDVWLSETTFFLPRSNGPFLRLATTTKDKSWLRKQMASSSLVAPQWHWTRVHPTYFVNWLVCFWHSSALDDFFGRPATVQATYSDRYVYLSSTALCIVVKRCRIDLQRV